MPENDNRADQAIVRGLSRTYLGRLSAIPERLPASLHPAGGKTYSMQRYCLSCRPLLPQRKGR